MTKQQFKQYIQDFDFTHLFNQLGWAHIKESSPVKAGEETFTLNSVAEKSGFRILICQPGKDGSIPEHPARLKIDNQVSRLFKEHLIIFINKEKTQQVWQTVQREMNKPAKLSSSSWHKGQESELLYQKASGLIFTLDEEDNITIVDVTKRVAENFHQNNERVTKQFYECFKKEHTSFLAFIKGIDTTANKDWYASLMLNRLMFCYFIQKKGFLDQNKNYLRDKLKLCQEKKGKGKFYSFYRSFLLVLFHEGLNELLQKEKVKIEIGTIPYLNGGLFDEHEIETTYKHIDIDDTAFERLFDFFDQYEWHLDTSTTATGKDINPDVIGYIFEKYINERAQMGAYYTKEDITDYISKNCIIPWLFDETARNYSKAFTANADIWTALKISGDEYIYEAVKHGISPLSFGEGPGVRSLPDGIAAGINDVSKRTEWNKPAPQDLGLPTEIWRETIERRKRYEEIKKKLQAGQLTSINDFITYNLNIRKFAKDIIYGSNDAEFIRHFYKSLNSVTIIDPTCGSGAFLFAAMNILEPLYHACITRMRGFTGDEDRHNEDKKQHFSNKYKYFREVLENIQNEQHPNLEYFIYKSIILNNLYGVDIMKEAVEIAKLRLFLKLVATVDADYKKRNLGLEPLPDIDFNIRAGNTLVGFASKNELKTGSLDFQEDEKKVLEHMEKVSMAFRRFKEIQLSGREIDYADFKTAKDDYQIRLKELKENLNRSFFNSFGNHKKGYKDWVFTYQPFHWFAEFYEIIHDKSGFDIIIGNPPYVNFKKVDYQFRETDFNCYECKDLFAITIERSFSINNSSGRNGFIIPLSGLSTETMLPLRKLIFSKTKSSWNSYYSASDQPASLFNGVRHRLLITVNEFEKNKKTESNIKRYSTNFLKWFSDERGNLFQKAINYVDVSNEIPVNSKISSPIEKEILLKLSKKKTLNNFITKSGSIVYYHNAPVHWGKIFDFVPFFSIGNKKQQSSHLKEIYFNSKEDASIVICLLNSTLFYWYNWQYSNCRDLSQKDIFRMPISLSEFDTNEKKKFVGLKNDLMTDLKKNSKLYKRVSNNITTEFDSFYPLLSKEIIDKIDSKLALHYKLSAEELDFIINYDIKYRMGKELEEEE